MQIQDLNDQFSIPAHILFKEGKGGLPMAEVRNVHATADIYLHGGHITAFRPRGATPVLWLSDLAQFEAGKAIRGGIPIIWPWFGPHSHDKSLPSHGFARTLDWQFVDTAALPTGETKIMLTLEGSDQSQQLFAYEFLLQLIITVGPSLLVDFIAYNTGNVTYTVSSALHSYFAVGDIAQAAVRGLAGKTYIDQLDRNQRRTQEGAITIDEEVDRIYLETADDCLISDPANQRNIRIAKKGSRSTVVWNPWVEKAKRMSDFDDEAYKKMVCVETANAGPDARAIPAGGQHHLQVEISVERP